MSRLAQRGGLLLPAVAMATLPARNTGLQHGMCSLAGSLIHSLIHFVAHGESPVCGGVSPTRCTTTALGEPAKPLLGSAPALLHPQGGWEGDKETLLVLGAEGGVHGYEGQQQGVQEGHVVETVMKGRTRERCKGGAKGRCRGEEGRRGYKQDLGGCKGGHGEDLWACRGYREDSGERRRHAEYRDDAGERTEDRRRRGEHFGARRRDAEIQGGFRRTRGIRRGHGEDSGDAEGGQGAVGERTGSGQHSGAQKGRGGARSIAERTAGSCAGNARCAAALPRPGRSRGRPPPPPPYLPALRSGAANMAAGGGGGAGLRTALPGPPPSRARPARGGGNGPVRRRQAMSVPVLYCRGQFVVPRAGTAAAVPDAERRRRVEQRCGVHALKRNATQRPPHHLPPPPPPPSSAARSTERCSRCSPWGGAPGPGTARGTVKGTQLGLTRAAERGRGAQAEQHPERGEREPAGSPGARAAR